MNTGAKFYMKNDKIPLIEEVVIDDNSAQDPNFILGDHRKELAIEEIILFLRKIKTMIHEKKIEVHIVMRPD